MKRDEKENDFSKITPENIDQFESLEFYLKALYSDFENVLNKFKLGNGKDFAHNADRSRGL